MADVLQVRGGDLVGPGGRSVRLRGVDVAGTTDLLAGLPGGDGVLREALGPVLAAHLRDRLAWALFGRADAEHVASLGLNLVRLPVDVHDGLPHLDRAIDLCAREGIYTVVDVHAQPGGRRRALDLWSTIAARYRGHPWIAAYDVTGSRLAADADDLLGAIRGRDADHVVLLPGDRAGGRTRERWPNVVHATRDQASPGRADGGPYPGISGGRYVGRDTLERTFLARTAPARERGAPIWVGEFGPVYTGDEERDRVRHRVLQDQLEIYERYGAHWTVWTYKDAGPRGLVHAAAGSPWSALVTGASEADVARRLGRMLLRDVEALATSFRLDRCERRARPEELLSRFAPLEVC